MVPHHGLPLHRYMNGGRRMLPVTSDAQGMYWTGLHTLPQTFSLAWGFHLFSWLPVFWKWVEWDPWRLQGNLYQKPEVPVLSHCLNLGEEWQQDSEGEGQEGRQLTLFFTRLICANSWDSLWFISSHGNLAGQEKLSHFTDTSLRVRERRWLACCLKLLSKEQSSKSNPELSTASHCLKRPVPKYLCHKLKRSLELSWALWMCPEALGLFYQIH